VVRVVGKPDRDGCRRRRGSCDRGGYPGAWRRGAHRGAHRLLFGRERGEILQNWTVDHTCRHRWCMEATHRAAVPRAEHARREAERRQHDRGTQDPQRRGGPAS
jgi:hypothetical protein